MAGSGQGARLVNTSELRPGQILDASLVKRVVGGETIAARALYKAEVEFTPMFVPIMTTNALPVIDGGDSALARRLVAVPFDIVVSEADQDPHLEAKLKAEASGIFRWMVEGLKDYRAHGLAVPATIKERTAEWIAGTDLIQQFLDDCYEPDPKGRVQPMLLQVAYRGWCALRGYAPLSERVLRDELAKRGIERRKSGNDRSYRGIREKPQNLRVVA